MYEFWNDFLANFLSDLIGVFLGALLGWWVSTVLSKREHRQEQMREQKAKTQRTLHYFRLLRQEIIKLDACLAPSLEALQQTGWGRVFRVETLFWDIIKIGGELPELIENSRLLTSLLLFYGALANARYGIEWICQTWLAPRTDTPGYNEKLQAFISLAVEGLEDAKNESPELIKLLDAEIKRLELVK